MVRDPRERAAAKPNQAPVDPQTRLHRELIRLLRRHSLLRDQRHLVLLAQRVAVLLLRQMACFDRWKSVLPLGHGLAASCQRRCQCWLGSAQDELEPLYGPLVLWALTPLQESGRTPASGARHHDALEPLLRRRSLGRLPWPGGAAAVDHA